MRNGGNHLIRSAAIDALLHQLKAMWQHRLDCLWDSPGTETKTNGCQLLKGQFHSVNEIRFKSTNVKWRAHSWEAW